MLNVEGILNALDVDFPDKGHSDWVSTQCPLHVDTHPSFSINLETGKWNCFAGCGAGSIYELVRRLRNCTFSEAFNYVANYRNEQSAAIEVDDILAILDGKNKAPSVPVLEEAKIEYDTTKVPKFLIDRGFKPFILKKFGIGYQAFTGAAVIPCEKWYILRNPFGSFLKYQYPANMPKSKILFGLDKCKLGGDVIVVEGPLDCVWMHQLGFDYTVAILGMYLSKDQASLLTKNFNRVIMMLDNDVAGSLGMSRCLDLYSKNEVELKIAKLPNSKKDPQECTFDEIQHSLQNLQDYIEWFCSNNGDTNK